MPPNSAWPRGIASPHGAAPATCRPNGTKLVRAAHGAVHDVLVDARAGSPTFGTVASFRLDDEEFHHLYVPAGLLHGFQALTEVADVCYRIDQIGRASCRERG